MINITEYKPEEVMRFLNNVANLRMNVEHAKVKYGESLSTEDFEAYVKVQREFHNYRITLSQTFVTSPVGPEDLWTFFVQMRSLKRNLEFISKENSLKEIQKGLSKSLETLSFILEQYEQDFDIIMDKKNKILTRSTR